MGICLTRCTGLPCLETLMLLIIQVNQYSFERERESCYWRIWQAFLGHIRAINWRVYFIQVNPKLMQI
ncbi:hypothetical protein HRbin15_02568 [bacterium HR15]|nr:hypothetical protein HRbin15_02568 [bacterium HR15]